MDFLVQIGKNECSFVDHYFASAPLHTQIGLLCTHNSPLILQFSFSSQAKIDQRAENPSFSQILPFIGLLMLVQRAKTKIGLYYGFNAYSMVITRWFFRPFWLPHSA